MKKFKLFLAAFVATLFAFVGGKAYADGYTITIKNASANHTYEAYQVFGGDLYKEDGAKTPTLSNIHWGTGVTAFTYDDQSDAAKIAEKLSGQTYDLETAKAFAKKVSANLVETTGESKIEGENLVITVPKPGYYFVKDADAPQKDQTDFAYTRFMMQVTGAEAVEVKNGVPSVQKKVKENSTGEWQAVADYDMGDTVPFQLTATLPKHIADYDHYYVEFTDTLSAGLKFDKITLVVKADGKPLSEGEYTVNATENQDGTTTLSVVITDVKAVNKNINKDDKVIVEYNATLGGEKNEKGEYSKADKVKFDSAGNPNSVELTYSNNPNATGDGKTKPTDTGKTPIDTVKVFTYQTIINKVGEDEKTPLAGAEFTLHKVGSTKNIDVVKNAEGTSFTFKGLDAGDYVLKETETPDGYNTINPIEFTIDAKYDSESDNPQLTKLSGVVTSGVAKFDANKADGSLKADIVTRKGSLLPSTGGMGTTILYVVGSILVLVAAILLITKKRMDAAK